MNDKYQISDEEGIYFDTGTVVGRADICKKGYLRRYIVVTFSVLD